MAVTVNCHRGRGGRPATADDFDPTVKKRRRRGMKIHAGNINQVIEAFTGKPAPPEQAKPEQPPTPEA